MAKPTEGQEKLTDDQIRHYVNPCKYAYLATVLGNDKGLTIEECPPNHYCTYHESEVEATLPFGE